MAKCDIIIPVYNAYDCLSPCIDSIILNTDLENNRLILIDDKSLDERVLPLLEKYENGNSIILLKNEENLGFVGTVNRGMKFSKNDVLLLNSDTEVSKNWLNKIIKCAYSEKMIATVTPLSNNATLVSVPDGLVRNDLPDNMSFDEYSELVESTAYNSNQQLPTAHGFCMFIKREVLDIVGYFDEKTFGKGYGEENDFSFRCMDYGYKNILCDNTIIFHKEKQSFSEKRKSLVEENSKKLCNRYPAYCKKIELWCENFPIRKQCENIGYQINLYNRKNILILIHDWNNLENNVGGTTLHVKDVIQELRGNYNFHVLYPKNGVYKLVSYFANCEKEIDVGIVNDYCNTKLYNKEYKTMLENVVDAFRIDTIHVHHMIGHYMDVVDVAKEKKIYSMITLHDFYCLCPNINMLYKMEKSCIYLDNKDCGECLYLKANLKNNIINVWQNCWKSFLSIFDTIITPSESTKNAVLKFYSDLNIKVIEHGVNLYKSDYIINEDYDVFNVAFVGVMAVHKGANILEYLIKNTKNKKIKYHLFGDSESKYLRRNRGNYVYHGKYKREELSSLLKEHGINLVCNLSICEETYSYTLTEVILSGVPVLGFDIGAVGERIKNTGCGYCISINESNDKIIKKIESIYSSKDEYFNILKNIRKCKFKTVTDMCLEYSDFYNIKKAIDINSKNISSLKDLIESFFNNKQNFSSIESDLILNSLRWRLISKISVPEFAKKIVRKMVK